MATAWYIHIAATDEQAATPERLEAITAELEQYDGVASTIDGALHVYLAVRHEDPISAGHQALTAVRRAHDLGNQALLTIEVRSEAGIYADLIRAAQD